MPSVGVPRVREGHLGVAYRVPPVNISDIYRWVVAPDMKPLEWKR